MAMRDSRTADLFDWRPPELERRFTVDVTRAASLKAAISKVVAATLRESDQARETISEKMSDYLGEDVTKPMLDAYASEARKDHSGDSSPGLRSLRRCQNSAFVLIVSISTIHANIIWSSVGNAVPLPVKTLRKKGRDRNSEDSRKRPLDAFRGSHQRSGNGLAANSKGRGDASERLAA